MLSKEASTIRKAQPPRILIQATITAITTVTMDNPTKVNPTEVNPIVDVAIMATTTMAIQKANNVPSLNTIPHNIINSIALQVILPKRVTPNTRTKITCNSCNPKVNRPVNNRNRTPHLNTA